MKMPNITPGPWVVEIEGVLTPKVVQSDGYGVCHTSYAPTRAMENATAIAALPDLMEALIAFNAAMAMPQYGDYSDFVFPAIKQRVECKSEWGNICEKHGLSYGGGCSCCADDYNQHQNRKDMDARFAKNDALDNANRLALASLLKAGCTDA